MEQTMNFHSIVEDVIRKLEESTEPSQTLGTSRADVKLIGQQYQEAKVGKFTLGCDEPTPSGGTDKAATPLEFFMSAIGFCENVMFTRHASLLNLQFDSLETSVRGHWDRRGQYGIGGAEPSFKDVTVETKVTTKDSVEKVVEVARRTHKGCPMHATIVKAMKVTDKLFVNGKEIPL
ncbi:OsmC family protein [Candidatus Bathyarchaeota archaeon]|nr:MAG: OsmC family protein [Candidatus Bathyarchaeota archaeon]